MFAHALLTAALLASNPPPSPGAIEQPIRYDDAIPQPRPLGPRPAGRKIGSNTTVFVNFDGVEISYCDPSNSHDNCSWFEDGRTFAPFSGGLMQRVAILDAMRSQVSEFGIRVTGQRPPADEPYVMVVYGGEREEDQPLGRAPSGDCYDDLPNEVAFVYLDGEDERTWVNGGAATALHEAAHTWGFDHIGLEGYLMAPAGGNDKANYFDGCAQIVDDVELTPSEAGSCPSISLEQCGLRDFQNDVALLHMLFGEPYVDDVAPRLELVAPEHGAYFQAPADFRVELRVIDDLHPQFYELAIAIEGLVDEPEFRSVVDPSFDVEQLPIGEWRFVLRLRDEAGNEGSLAFTVEVGEDPPPSEDGCTCSTRQPSQGWTLALGLPLIMIFIRRRRPPIA
jgi:hypothetical protein